MSKQTAVEWLFAHLLPFLPFSDAKEREHFRKCLEEAKAMEREQILNSRLSLFIDLNKMPYGMEYFGHLENALEDAEQYYKETYKGKEQ